MNQADRRDQGDDVAGTYDCLKCGAVLNWLKAWPGCLLYEATGDCDGEWVSRPWPPTQVDDQGAEQGGDGQRPKDDDS